MAVLLVHFSAPGFLPSAVNRSRAVITAASKSRPSMASSEPRKVQQSKGEFTVAKHGYVVSNCGWFSERSAHYMASGRPVITQETGFSEWLPTGAGLFSFSSPDDVIAALEELDRDYAYHCREARALAEQFFDSDKVLSRLIDLAMATVPSTPQDPPLSRSDQP